MAKPKQVEEPKQPSSADVLGSILEASKDEHFAFVKPENRVISTGSLKLDSLVKIRSGGVVRLVGKGAELGKTSEAFVIAANFMKTMPKAKTLFVKAEARLSLEMRARAGLTFVESAAEWKQGTVFILPCNIFERVAETVVDLLKTMHELDEQLCIIIDSLDGLRLRADSKKDMWGGDESPKVAGVQYLTKLLFRDIGLPVAHYDALLIVTGQYSAAIKLDPYAPADVRQADSAGGNSIAHQSDYVFQYLPRYGKSYILQDPDEKPDMIKNKIIGINADIEIKKSGTDVSGTKVSVPIRKGRVGSAIWIEKEIVDMLLMWEMLKKRDKGAWLYFDEGLVKEVRAETGEEIPEKILGLPAVNEYMEGNPKVVKYLYDKFLKLVNPE